MIELDYLGCMGVPVRTLAIIRVQMLSEIKSCVSGKDITACPGELTCTIDDGCIFI